MSLQSIKEKLKGVLVEVLERAKDAGLVDEDVETARDLLGMAVDKVRDTGVVDVVEGKVADARDLLDDTLGAVMGTRVAEVARDLLDDAKEAAIRAKGDVKHLRAASKECVGIIADSDVFKPASDIGEVKRRAVKTLTACFDTLALDGGTLKMQSVDGAFGGANVTHRLFTFNRCSYRLWQGNEGNVVKTGNGFGVLRNNDKGAKALMNWCERR